MREIGFAFKRASRQNDRVAFARVIQKFFRQPGLANPGFACNDDEMTVGANVGVDLFDLCQLVRATDEGILLGSRGAGRQRRNSAERSLLLLRSSALLLFDFFIQARGFREWCDAQFFFEDARAFVILAQRRRALIARGIQLHQLPMRRFVQ